MTLTEAWCRSYTRLAPDEEAERRRAEVASHVYEAKAFGVRSRRLALETGLGCLADLVWTDRARRRQGRIPLLLLSFVDRSVGAIVGGLLVLVTFVLSALPGEPFWGGNPLAWAAGAMAASGHMIALVRRVKRRER